MKNIVQTHRASTVVASYGTLVITLSPALLTQLVASATSLSNVNIPTTGVHLPSNLPRLFVEASMLAAVGAQSRVGNSMLSHWDN
jgi:hypothetical protein